MMKCEKCGQQLNNWNAYCPNCGEKASDDFSGQEGVSAQSKSAPISVDGYQSGGGFTKVIGVIGILVGAAFAVQLLFNTLTGMRYWGILSAFSSGLAGLLLPIFLVIGGAYLLSNDRKGFDILFFKTTGLACMVCGAASILGTVLGFIRILSFVGTYQAIISVAPNAIWPLLLILCGFAILSDQDGYGAPAVFITGTYCAVRGTNILIMTTPILGRFGDTAVSAWSGVLTLAFVTVILLTGVTLLVNKKTESDSRKIVLFNAAVGLFVGVISFFALGFIGRLFQMPDDAFAYFIIMGRTYCFTIPLTALYLAFNSLILTGNIRAYIEIATLHIAVTVLLIPLGILTTGFGMSGTVISVLIVEFIRLVISGLVFLRKRRGSNYAV